MGIEAGAARFPMRRRALWLGIGVALMIGWALAVRDDPDDSAAIAVPVAPGSRDAGAGQRILVPRAAPGRDDKARLSQLTATLAGMTGADARRRDIPALGEYGKRSWVSRVPLLAPVPEPLANAAAPAEPEIPFQWVGRWEQPGGAGETPPPMAILSGATGTWVVKKGDIVAGDWKVDSITSDQIQLLYLPISSLRTLSLNKQ